MLAKNKHILSEDTSDISISILNRLRMNTIVSLALLLSTTAQCAYIVPGARWHDTDNNIVNAHAGCVTVDKDTGKFWLFGEYKIPNHTEGAGVSVYSSDNLATWQHHGLALSAQSRSTVLGLLMTSSTGPIDGHPYISPKSIIQRPKVVYSEVNDEYHVCPK
jgi:hypothetical protein